MDDTTLRIYFPKTYLKKLPTRIDLHYSFQKQMLHQEKQLRLKICNYKTVNIQGSKLVIS